MMTRLEFACCESGALGLVISKSRDRESSSTRVQSEWENFESAITSGNPSSARSSYPSSMSQEDSCASGGPQSESETMSVSSLNTKPVVSDNAKRSVEEDDEDESHLPPGVRRKNRCHTSSSEDEEEEKKKGSESSASDSESDASPRRDAAKNKVESENNSVKENSKSTEVSGSSKKARDSRSKSRSRSPSRRKRRRSSDRSRHSRSRSRDRGHRKDRKRKSHRSRSKDRRRSRDREHRRRREHKRSRSRSRDKRDRHKERRSRSRDRSRRERSRDHSRSRDRSRSRERSRRNRSRSSSPKNVIKFGDKVIKPGASFGRPPPSKPMTFKEKMRQQLIKAIEGGGDVSSALTNDDGTALCTQTAGTQQMPAAKKPPVPLMANLVTSTAGLSAMTVTPSEAAMQSMLAMQKEATAKTGVEIPKYYNPAAINPMKYAEQVQKRKLLWSKNKDKEVVSQWHATTLSSDHDDKSKEKFRKLMGIRQESGDKDGSESEKVIEEQQEQKQREIFDKLDKEYQYARMATHTHRGIGLGFGSASYQQPPTTSS
ncbi:arginine/serine-rich coiled-coil protein 2 isoform X2 [Aplysia californica]|uniref:Arginine/serine-rich coiled-coil protein 2 isoform X2 n=1 Tax=Aplysia californica TaxID=6500 RepID=A0ABM0JHD5_APLCA|nr:arginine/serine-rich coiled-coil protein 2 isoform X2 [Aplysia californica]